MPPDDIASGGFLSGLPDGIVTQNHKQGEQTEMYFDYITDEQLKRDVRELKVFKNIKYSTIAERLGIKYKSFSNWMNG